MDAKKIYNLETERIKRESPKKIQDSPDEIIEKAVGKFTECMIIVLPKLINNLKACVDEALKELTNAAEEAGIDNGKQEK